MNSKDKENKTNAPEKSGDQPEGKSLTRREILQKYGAYTAPVVVSMLAPKQAFAMFGGTTFDTLNDCWAAHGHNPSMMHCANMHRILN